MLTTYKLTGGHKVVGDSNDIVIVDTGSKPLAQADWMAIADAISQNKIVLNLAHIVLIQPANDTERKHYDGYGAG